MDKLQGTAFFYVVLCQDQSLYTGYSTDVIRRVNVHNAGKGAKYTKLRRPVLLLYAKEYSSKSEAMRAEASFKKRTRAQKINYLQAHQVNLQGTGIPVIEYLEKERKS